MNEEHAREILARCLDVSRLNRAGEGLCDRGWYLEWEINWPTAILDGGFTADELEAIAFWMRRKP